MIKSNSIYHDKYDEKVRKRILNSIEKNENNCWIWKKSKVYYGYGAISYKSKSYSAHRVSYTLFKGEIPKGMIVCHSCDIPSCVNPEHLWVGTHKQNTRDMMNKKNVFQFKGEKNNLAKLTEDQVLEIRRMRKEGYKTVEIAKLYSIHQSTVSDIHYRNLWSHI